MELINGIEGRSIDQILGYPDDMKFRSCLTLFLQAAPGHPVLEAALERYYRGERDPRTLELLSAH
ncbi:hypothetical protein D3C86_2161350 [compost metagenome]